MKILKRREKSKLQIGLNYLDKRTRLNSKDKQYLINMEKEFEGEERFDALVKTYLTGDILVLNDLMLESNGSAFQVDALVITAEAIYVYEVKNDKGNFQMSSGQLTYTSGKEVANSLIQLKRSKAMFRQLLNEFGCTLKVEANVVFVNEAFTLYDAEPTDPIIFPTQIRDHFEELNGKSRSLTKQHHYVADKLIDAHKGDHAFRKRMPAYTLEEFKTGVSCSCGSFDLIITQQSCYCKACYKRMTIEELVTESVRELKFLFPEQKLTTSVVNEWCGNAVYHRKIRSILQDNFKATGTNRGIYYE